MKKIFFALFISMILLTGCGNNDNYKKTLNNYSNPTIITGLIDAIEKTSEINEIDGKSEKISNGKFYINDLLDSQKGYNVIVKSDATYSDDSWVLMENNKVIDYEIKCNDYTYIPNNSDVYDPVVK